MSNVRLKVMFMDYLNLSWVAIKWFVAFWVLSVILRFFLPSHIQESFERMDLFFLERIAAIPVFLSSLWFFSATVLYFLGNFTVLLLLGFGVFMLSYSIYLHIGNVEFTFEWWYRLAIQLVEEKAAWSGATMIVGATVAIANMWKLNLDKKQYFEKREKERREEYEERKKKASEQSKYRLPG